MVINIHNVCVLTSDNIDRWNVCSEKRTSTWYKDENKQVWLS